MRRFGWVRSEGLGRTPGHSQDLSAQLQACQNPKKRIIRVIVFWGRWVCWGQALQLEYSTNIQHAGQAVYVPSKSSGEELVGSAMTDTVQDHSSSSYQFGDLTRGMIGEATSTIDIGKKARDPFSRHGCWHHCLEAGGWRSKVLRW